MKRLLPLVFLAFLLASRPSAAADLVVANQEKDRSAAGSWAPVGAQASDGRIAETARAILVILNARGVNLPEPVKAEKGK
jgi:hypothetical protein